MSITTNNKRCESSSLSNRTEKNVPSLRFAEFDGDWTTTPIHSFLKIQSGLGFKAGEYSSKPEVRLLQIENVGYQKVKWSDNVKYLPHNYLDEHKSLVLSQGDVVLALNRPVTNNKLKIAKLTDVDAPSILYQRVGKINILSKDVSLNYIFQYFQTYLKNYVLRSFIGSDQPFISITNLYKQNILIPEIIEQQKIASFLSSVDSKISLLQQKHNQLQQYKKGVMQQLFSQKIRFTQADGCAYPDWEEKKLGDVAKFSKGKGISKADIVSNGKLPCIRYGELYTHYQEIISDVISYTNVDSSELIISEENDVIIPASGETAIDIATVACVTKSGIALSGDLNIIKSPLNGMFLAYYLGNHKKYKIASLAQGISVSHIYASQLSLLKISIPCHEEQQKIVECLMAIDAKIDALADQLANVQAFKKGLLQKMFV